MASIVRTLFARPEVGAALLALTVLTAACGGSQRPTTVMRPLEERRARAILEEVVANSGATPAAPRVVVEARTGKELEEDLAIAGLGADKYGIAYVTERELQQLGDAIPPYDPEKSSLTLVRGGSGEVVGIFYAEAYEYDAGPEHSTTVVTVEGKLRRDIGDYVRLVVEPNKVR